MASAFQSLIDDGATRRAGLARLDAFAPRMGKRYASGRNYDRGPHAEPTVSLLSPYLRRRLITEEETVARAVADHGLDAAEKFIQEVFWRGYFKGWLERRPETWRRYVDGLAHDRFALSDDRRLAKRVVAAEEGRTGIDCFDAWAEELVETGYLHNHTRMWFASIWIFTLDLPWRLGADFFYRHLVDGDPASNTLSWRWVAGLHTRGKAYAAQAWNIAKFTNQRFEPSPKDLNEAAVALTEDDETPSATPLRTVPTVDEKQPSLLLITEEDCRLEEIAGDLSRFRAAASLATTGFRSDGEIGASIAAFERAALIDAAERATAAGAPRAIGLEPLSTKAFAADLIAAATEAGATQIVTGYAPVGPLRDQLDLALPHLAENGVVVAEIRRDWDALIWPHATAGFFKVKAKIPKILEALGDQV